MSIPERIELYMSRWTIVGLIALSVIFVWGGVYIARSESLLIGILVVLFFGCGILIFLAMLFRPTGVIFADEGLTFRGLRSDRTYPWEGISQIKVGKMPGRGFFRPKRVWFNLDPSTLGPTERKVAALTGGRGMLSSNYGYKVEDLAEMVRAFQARALARAVTPEDGLQ